MRTIEVGAGFGYINSRWAIPFELSVEPTYRRNKHVNGTQEFSRVRTFALAELWSRSPVGSADRASKRKPAAAAAGPVDWVG